jgi:hypothetical protein
MKAPTKFLSLKRTNKSPCVATTHGDVLKFAALAMKQVYFLEYNRDHKFEREIACGISSIPYMKTYCWLQHAAQGGGGGWLRLGGGPPNHCDGVFLILLLQKRWPSIFPLIVPAHDLLQVQNAADLDCDALASRTDGIHKK